MVTGGVYDFFESTVSHEQRRSKHHPHCQEGSHPVCRRCQHPAYPSVCLDFDEVTIDLLIDVYSHAFWYRTRLAFESPRHQAARGLTGGRSELAGTPNHILSFWPDT